MGEVMNVKDYIIKNLDNIKRDCKRLIDIKSVKDTPKEGAPFGEGIRNVQLEAIKMCEQLGFETVDLDNGIVSYAHFGPSDRFIGMASHLDVVPAIDGWDTPPYCCTEKEGYLVGRGAYDNKIPFVLTAYAAKYFKDNEIPLKYGFRIFMGTDEESGMTDIKHYMENYQNPVFSFTPDHKFPVCHGEKGRYETNVVSKKLLDRAVISLEGGNASNAVADRCKAHIKKEFAKQVVEALTGNSYLSYQEGKDDIAVIASGASQHASTPHGSVNANFVMTELLLKSGILKGEEKSAVEFINQALGSLDGEFFNIQSNDGIFTPLTIIGGMLNITDDSYVLNLDSRYPSSITSKEISNNIKNKALEYGFSIGETEDMPTHLISAQNPAIEALMKSYKEVTGYDEKPYVMAGGTYARVMPNAVSFGIMFENRKKAEWAGTPHMKDEAVPISDIIDATEIFIKALSELQSVDF